MRMFYLLTVAMVVFLATATAKVDQRLLRVTDDDDAEERQNSNMFSRLNDKIKVMNANVRSMITAANADRRINAEIISSIKRGESKSSVLTRLKVKPLSTDAKGDKTFNPKDPVVQKYEYLSEHVHFKEDKW